MEIEEDRTFHWSYFWHKKKEKHICMPEATAFKTATDNNIIEN